MKRVKTLGLFAVVLALVVGSAATPAGAQGIVAVLDANPAPGYQGAVAVERVAPDAVVALEVRGRGLEGAVGFAVTIEYGTELVFDGWTSSQIIPGLTGLTIEDAGGVVEIGGASLDGAAEVDGGPLGVIRFRPASGFSGGAEVTITEFTVSGPDGEETVEEQFSVVVGAPPPGPIVLDGDLTPGWQKGVVIRPVEPGQVVRMEIVGRDLAGAVGFSATLDYDEDELEFVGWTHTEIIPGLTGLTLPSGPGEVEIGGATLAGAAVAEGGRLGVVSFRVLDGFSGQAGVSVDGGTLVGADGPTDSDVKTTVWVGALGDVGEPGVGTPLPTGDVGPLALDVDLSPGDQKDRDLKPAPAAGAEIEIEIAITKGGSGALGVEAVLEYDSAALEYVDFGSRDVFGGALGIPTAQDGTLNISLAFVGGSAGSDAGSVGVVKFKVLSGFSQETVVKLISGQLAYTTGNVALEIGPGGSYVVIGGVGPAVPNGDFDGDGVIGFTDFINFAQVFNSTKGDGVYVSSYDMDQNDKIDFTDFILFAQVYGKPPAKLAKTVSTPGGLNAGAKLTMVSEAPVAGLRSYLIHLADASSVSGFCFTVSFDGTALEYVGAENLAGSVFSQTGEVALQVDRSAGTVVLADALPGAVANGDLVRLTFRDLTMSGRVEISQAVVSDPAGRVDVLMGARLDPAVEGPALHQNVPNPFNPQTQIAYSLPEAARVRLSIYSVDGQKVADLVDAAVAPGRHLVTWDARDAVGRDVASGVYFYRMEANGVLLNRKMLLLR